MGIYFPHSLPRPHLPVHDPRPPTRPRWVDRPLLPIYLTNRLVKPHSQFLFMTVKDTHYPEHATRQRILDAASSAFAADGFGGARVDEIARRAGVNKALLYYHVGNKQTLYTAVLMRNFDRVEAALAEVMTSGGSARDRLTAVIATVTRTMQTYPDHPRIVLRELASAGGHLEPAVLERMMRVLGSVRHLLSDGVRSVVADFGANEYVSSAGLRVFLTVLKFLEQHDGRIVLCAMQPFVNDVFEISGFSDLFVIVESREDAVARFA